MRVNKFTISPIGFVVALIAAIAFLAPSFTYAAPATFEVNSTADGGDANTGDGVCETATPGQCTLRAAIEQANANGNPSDQDEITFNISGAAPHTIVQTGLYYNITQAVSIDGYTQSDSSVNTAAWPDPLNGTPTIEIDSSSHTGGLTAFLVNTSNFSVKGLILNGSPDAVFMVQAGSNNITFTGNYMGVNASGLVADYSTSTVISTADTDNLTIGGSNPEDRNIIAGTGKHVVSIGDNAVVRGNYFGVGADGVVALPSTGIVGTGLNDYYGDNIQIGGTTAGQGNTFEGSEGFENIYLVATNSSVLGNRISSNNGGINVGESDNLAIGDGTSAGRNVISGNDIPDPLYDECSDGITLNSGDGAVSIQGNYIGVAEDGTTPFSNCGHGIDVGNSSNVIIGGVVAGEANVIANNEKDGVNISNVQGVGVSILGNSIYDNGRLGINLVGNGENSNLGVPTPNDALDADTGPNDLLNFPEVFPGVVNGANTDVTYKIDVPAGDYRIDFYSNSSADPSGHGEGEDHIGYDLVTSTGTGEQQFNTTLTGNTHTNMYATTTEIDVLSPSGYGSTSEFSDFAQEDVDAEVTKTVVDQSTIATDGTIQYEVTYTNNGTDPINPTLLDAGGGLDTALFNDIFPDNLTFVSVAGDADCSTQNTAGTFAPLFDNHGTYTVLSCGYTGVDTAVGEGESLSFTLTFNVLNPLETVFTNYILSVPTGFDPETTAYDDAVGTGEDIIDELGTNINNLSSAATTMPETDVSITKELTNPEDVAQGATLNYQFTYTNNGPDVLNLAEFNGAPPLLLDILHPDLTPSDLGAPGPFPGTFYISDTGNADIVCLWAGSGSVALFMPSYTNHLDYGVISCLYIGADTALEDDGSLQMDLNFTVANDSELAFTNYASATSPTASEDPDQDDINTVNNSGNDGISETTSSFPTLNNFAMAELPADIDISAELENTGDISPDDSVYYNVTLTNNGDTGIDLTTFNNLVNKTLLAAAYSAEDLTLVGSTTTDTLCLSIGPGSIIYIGNAGNEHPDYQLLICTYTGSSQVLAPGDSFTLRLQFTADSDVSNSFNFYAFQGTTNGDPEMPSLFTDLYGASEDVLDTITNENYARVAYVGSGATEEVVDNTLSDTGQNRKILAFIAGLTTLVAGAIAVRMLFVRKRNCLH